MVTSDFSRTLSLYPARTTIRLVRLFSTSVKRVLIASRAYISPPPLVMSPPSASAYASVVASETVKQSSFERESRARTVEKEASAFGLLNDFAHFDISLAHVFTFELEGILLDEVVL